jgi:hypothetical protein
VYIAHVSLANFLHVVHCVCRLVGMTSGAGLLASQVTDTWALLSLSSQSDSGTIKARGPLTEKEEGTEGRRRPSEHVWRGSET